MENRGTVMRNTKPFGSRPGKKGTRTRTGRTDTGRTAVGRAGSFNPELLFFGLELFVMGPKFFSCVMNVKSNDPFQRRAWKLSLVQSGWVFRFGVIGDVDLEL